MAKWQQKFRNDSKKNVTTGDEIDVTYGKEVYVSPTIFCSEPSKLRRWLVTEFKGEYNLFLENIKSGKTFKKFCASFRNESLAKKFALEMMMVLSGKATRTERVI